jgi:hypothetical protein
MYKVFDKVFATFEEVEKWAYNTYKIDTDPEYTPITEEEKQAACAALEKHILSDEEVEFLELTSHT